VATVVLKLFQIVQPDVAYFGQKDAQQVRIVQQMVGDLNVPVQLRVCPIVRDPDGLAVSSRNQYLNPEQREHATVLATALRDVERLVGRGERQAATVQRTLRSRIEATSGAVLDYAAVVDGDTLQPLERLRGNVLVAVAVRFGQTRVIDNIQLQLPAD
jgi:pantoate--beta-alanine ligase